MHFRECLVEIHMLSVDLLSWYSWYLSLIENSLRLAISVMHGFSYAFSNLLEGADRKNRGKTRLTS